MKLISLSARAVVTSGCAGALAVGALVGPSTWGADHHGWKQVWSGWKPVATTMPASAVSSTGATLNGSVSTRSHATSAYFQWGTTTSYGTSTPLSSVPSSSSSSVPVSSALGGLKGGTTYHFRLVVPTNSGTSYGKDVSFQTAATATPTTTTTTPAPTTTTSTPTASTTTTAPAPTTTTTSPAPTTSTTSAPTTTTTTTAPSPTTTSSSCTPQWTSSAAQGSWSTNGYLVNNNMWASDAGPQTISACAWNKWSISSNQPGTGANDSVKTYADTQKHVSLPLSSLSSLPSSFDVTTPAGGGTVPTNGKQWNAAYDLWLDNYGTEVMVWNNWTMNWQYWYGVNNGVQLTVDGIAYHAYTNGSGIWFVRDNVTNKGTVDLAHLLQWAVSKGWLKSSQTLGEVEYGFEVSYTGTPTTFTLNNYSLSTP